MKELSFGICGISFSDNFVLSHVNSLKGRADVNKHS